MTVYSIQRDWGPPPSGSLVRIVTDDAIEDIIATGWLALQQADIERVNNGPFEWYPRDSVLLTIIDANGNASYVNIFSVFPDRNSLNPIVQIYPNLQNIVAHAGGGQTLATQLNLGINVVTTVASPGDSVKLPDDVVGQTVIVTNTGANSLNIFPFPGDNINNLGINVPISLSPQATAVFIGVDNNDWRTVDANIYQTTSSIIAHAGGGQANATQTNLGINVVTTVATQQDSVKLPTTVQGQTVIIANKGLNGLALYPASGNSINGLAADTSLTIFPNESYAFYGVSASNWVAINTSDPVYGYNPGIVAHPGGGQANAVILKPGLNIVSTVATGADSIKLPQNSLGQSFYVRNSGANALAIFPFEGGAFYGSATDTSILINANSRNLFVVTEPLFIDTIS